MHRGRFTYLAVALVALLAAVAMPAVAIAQSSGEDQYTDPLAGGGGSGGSSGGGSGGGGGGGSAPAQPASSSAASTPAPAAKPAQASSGKGLPRTGFPVALLVGSGLIMVGTGLAVRRRTT